MLSYVCIQLCNFPNVYDSGVDHGRGSFFTPMIYWMMCSSRMATILLSMIVERLVVWVVGSPRHSSPLSVLYFGQR